MPTQPPARLYRFGVYEADLATKELRRKGIRVRLHAQPFQVLALLLERPGEMLTREEICQQLWPAGTFVDSEHGLNSAMNRLRDALGDQASNPRFIETLARRGYRFIGQVERIEVAEIPLLQSANGPISEPAPPQGSLESPTIPGETAAALFGPILATPEDLPHTSHTVVQTLFLLLQLMYIGFYIGALTNLAEIGDLLSVLSFARQAFLVLVVTATILLPVRTFLLCAALFRAPGMRGKFLKLWLVLLPFDILWSLAPFLLLHHINYGLALACMTFLVYSPFAQRSLVLMGAGAPPAEASATAP